MLKLTLIVFSSLNWKIGSILRKSWLSADEMLHLESENQKINLVLISTPYPFFHHCQKIIRFLGFPECHIMSCVWIWVLFQKSTSGSGTPSIIHIELMTLKSGIIQIRYLLILLLFVDGCQVSCVRGK